MTLYGNIGLDTAQQNTTHEGATQYEIDNPLLDLVFTKGAVVFSKGYYQSQANELQAFAKALRKAEAYEPGFGWKYGAYMRDPKNGKGNRIQGSVVPAILVANNPEEVNLVKEYVTKCLSHRPDDLVAFVAHFENLNLMPLSKLSLAVREGLAEALESFSDYQLLKYKGTTVDRVETRRKYNKKEDKYSFVPKTLRLVDVMGLCYQQLSPRLLKIYNTLHSSTHKHDTSKWEGFTTQRTIFKNKDLSLLHSSSSLSLAQTLSTFGNTKQVWEKLFENNLVPDMAFVLNIRNLAKAGYIPDELNKMVQERKFYGIWPQQMYVGYKAIKKGSKRGTFKTDAMPEYGEVFEEILTKAIKDLIPWKRSLGFGDVSSSMSCEINKFSSLKLMDISKVLCACTAATSGYAATFDNSAHIASIDGYKGPFDLVLNAPEMNTGWGGTQVYGAVMKTIEYIKKHDIEPFEVLYFFSDMQFHPPQATTTSYNNSSTIYGKNTPPLEAALVEWQKAFELAAPKVVLWNLSSYAGAPLQSDYPGVAFVSGFDAQIFRHINEWLDDGGRTVTRSKITDKEETMSNLLDYIRGF